MYLDVDVLDEVIVGKKIIAIFLDAEYQRYIRLQTSDGVFDFECEGDCCSETWIADLLGVDNMIGATVVSCKCKELPDYNIEDGRGRQEEDQVYGFAFKTTKGDFDLIFRNSSNGYYGGWMNYIGGGEATPSDIRWMRVTSDYPC